LEKNEVNKILLCEEISGLTTLSKPNVLPSRVKSIIKELDDVFPKEGPTGLPPFRGHKTSNCFNAWS